MLTRRGLLLSALTGSPRKPLARAAAVLSGAVERGQLRAAVLAVSAQGRQETLAFGEAHPDSAFLLASITKPMTATAVMMLVERGRLALDQPAHRWLPELAGGDRERITLRHLLSHSSGLPDMLPDNEALRRRHAPLAEFVAGACRAPLRFPPGSDTRYQSMGFLLAAEIAARATRTSFAEHLRTAVLEPLGMRATSLGLGARRLEETIPCQVPDEDWGWNSRYWRSLGAPWGGAIGTAPDLLRLLRFFAHPGRGPLGPEAAQAMLTAQIAGGRPHEYGLGWRLGPFAKGGTPQTFGHGGATGCVAWFDRGKDLGCVVLTSLPEAAGKTTVLGPVSAAVLAAF